jgi:UDP-N-acetylglucosamine 2-epimerase (non-hydrolysing)
MIKLVIVAGARPNFVKVAPIVAELQRYSSVFSTTLVHTGQHYTESMSQSFFEDLSIPQPDIFLDVGSASHARQTGEIMKRFEPVLLEVAPDFVLVVGDVNSTLACALTAAKLHIRVIHVEAGLRSFDRTMPEEINRVLTDHLADLLFVTEESGRQNLIREGIDPQRIHFVGNVMIDSLLKHLRTDGDSDKLSSWGLSSRNYGLVTLHRPSNVDDPEVLERILSALVRIAERFPLLFPLHPRTEATLRQHAFQRFFSDEPQDCSREPRGPGLYTTGPIRYIDWLVLLKNARLVLTDSGGIQEETTALGVPCLTLRHNTERPVTVQIGTNLLVGTDPDSIVRKARRILAQPGARRSLPPLWDGHTAGRILNTLLKQVETEVSGSSSVVPRLSVGSR